MAKDAKGHGSEKRGGIAANDNNPGVHRPVVAPHAGVKSVGTHRASARDAALLSKMDRSLFQRYTPKQERRLDELAQQHGLSNRMRDPKDYKSYSAGSRTRGADYDLRALHAKLHEARAPKLRLVK